MGRNKRVLQLALTSSAPQWQAIHRALHPTGRQTAPAFLPAGEM